MSVAIYDVCVREYLYVVPMQGNKLRMHLILLSLF